ncbi:MAG: hypothetical protein EXQ94_00875 [Alphaproteobacteria bacterium]|nr:hypothetical protein [Alphaproteobacteria bacterium]
MADVIDLATYRNRREGSAAPGRRRGRPYRYDPGLLAGKDPKGGNTAPRGRPTPTDDNHKTPA